MQKEKWQIYTRGTIPLHRIDIFNHLREAALKHNKKYFCEALYACENSKVWWAWDKKGIKEWSEILIQSLSQKESRSTYYKKYEDFSQRAIKAAEIIRATNLSEFSNNELVKLYNYLEKESSYASGFTNIDLDVFDIFFEEFLKNKIKEKADLSEIFFTDIYRELSAPVYQTFISKEEEEIIALAALKREERKKSAKKIYDDFWWVSLGWENIIPRDIKYYEKEITKYSRKKNLKEIIAEIARRRKDVSKKRKNIIKKYKLGDEIEELLRVLDKFVYFHDLRKEMQVRVFYSFNLLLSEAAKRFGIKEKNKEWYSHSEIISVLKGKKIDIKEIEKRRKAVLVLVDKSGVKIFSGSEAVRRRKKELEEEIKNVSELKGMSATKGRVIARAKVCNGIEEARKKVKKGDVLVVGMTLPDYVPVMKIASAIITDEGGITCHAAIISRELKIPCIIGTKIATKVLRDGDLVEVDADQGVIKIIK
ncbi:hypothetical protein KKH38_02770 [Patescibacteria group bacterium]|nr:hypothetical protein [Patescibacteria group bacterium]MBU4600950.1 hypothetical protein [Patescibacteria group bacterium]MCG2697980.1 hypothetical protein [Candidatus Parcubacteria bacterium]MCG2699914.1 hypothetical protein [Candidatus Parcubacteria bacterium]